MWISDFISRKRWFFMSLAAALIIPSITLATMAHFAEDMSEGEALEVAAVAVKNYIDQNPPRQGWRATNIYIDDENNVVVDVHVPRFEHAKMIKSRKERVQYSYLKLACPPEDAWVFEWLQGDDRIWVHLHHHGRTLIKAACPNNRKKSFLS